MDMAPAAAEAAVEAGAVVEVACVQQYAAAAAWVRQRAACVCAAAGGSGQGNDQRAAVGSRCGMRATACSGSSVCAAAGGILLSLLFGRLLCDYVCAYCSGVFYS
jgi:hypothetical protein